MTSIVLKQFSGELPNIPKYNLPDFNAQQALNCDFAQKDLRPLKDGLEVLTATNNIKGVYTEDGLKFMTWPIETYAFKSPVVADQFQRVYFNNTSGLKVTTLSNATLTGGEPAEAWKVGVPLPTAAPALTLVNLTGLRDYPNAAPVFIGWYEIGGVRYQEGGLAFTTNTAWKNFTYTKPAKTGTTPADAVFYLSFRIINGADTVMSITLADKGYGTASSSAVPGGVELVITSSGATTSTINLTWGKYETRAYIYTLTNTFNEESGPSPAATIDVSYLEEVQVAVQVPNFGGYRPHQETKIYRTFGSSPSYVHVDVESTGTNVFVDHSFNTQDIGTGLYTLDYEPPPDGLFGLTALPNGAFAAFKDNALYMCEPYRPHTWHYKMTFPTSIRGICMGSQALIVTCANGSHLVLGNTPAQMQSMPLPAPQAGITHRSMVQLEGTVAFGSNDGIVLVNGSQATLDISQKFFSREDWRSRYATILDDVRFAYHDGFLVAVSSSENKGFIVRMDEAAGTFTQFNVRYDSAYYLPVADTLYYSIGNKLYRFRDGDYYQADWWSKEFILGQYTSFGAAYVRCRGPVTVSIYADNVLWHSFEATQTGYFRLPAGKRALSWSVRFQTEAALEEFVMAESMGELRSV